MDGVLANFDAAYQAKLCQISGKTLPANFQAIDWHWEEAAGFTSDDLDHTWNDIRTTPFWLGLEPYPTTHEVLSGLDHNLALDVYFITSRVGQVAKAQTETWLEINGFPSPTVLISREKGLCCKALELDFYIDDRRKNVFQCAQQSPTTRTFLLDRPWNQGPLPETVTRVESVLTFMEAVNSCC